MHTIRACAECGKVGGHRRSCSSFVETATRPHVNDSPFRETEDKPREAWKTDSSRTEGGEGGARLRYCGACGQAGHYRKTCPHKPGTWFGPGAAPPTQPPPPSALPPPSAAPHAALHAPPPAPPRPFIFGDALFGMDVRKSLELAMPKPAAIDACPACLSTTHCRPGCDAATRPPPPPPNRPEPSQVQDWPPMPWAKRTPSGGGGGGGGGGVGEGSWKVADDGWAFNGPGHVPRGPPWQHEQEDWVARTARKLGDGRWA